MKYENSFNEGIVIERDKKVIFRCYSCKYPDSPKVKVNTINNVAHIFYDNRKRYSLMFDKIDLWTDFK